MYPPVPKIKKQRSVYKMKLNKLFQSGYTQEYEGCVLYFHSPWKSHWLSLLRSVLPTWWNVAISRPGYSDSKNNDSEELVQCCECNFSCISGRVHQAIPGYHLHRFKMQAKLWVKQLQVSAFAWKRHQPLHNLAGIIIHIDRAILLQSEQLLNYITEVRPLEVGCCGPE